MVRSSIPTPGAGFVAALVALMGVWSCGGQVTGGGTGGHSTGGAHAASTSKSATASASTSTASAGGAGGSLSHGGAGGAGGSPSTGGAGGVAGSPGSGGAGGGTGCPKGEEPCNGVCVDVEHDPSNCGGCGNACVVPHGTAACTQGACTIATCDPGWTDCNLSPTDGCEANLMSDPLNCGACDYPCGAPCECQAGMCGTECPAGEANCKPPPGVNCILCDTLLGTNTDCNFCNDACALPNATSQCMQNTAPPPASAFMCALVSCNAGFADCDMVASNGCEVDTTKDPFNCGGCGNACAPSQTCSGGVCQ